MKLTLRALLLLLLPALLFPGDWPNFRGPDFDNKCKETGLLKTWPKNGLPLKWKFDGCGKGYSSALTSNGLIFVAGDSAEECRITALDINGNKKWEASNGKAWVSRYDGVRCSPLINDGLVFHLNAYGQLSAFKASDGSLVWSVDIKKTFNGRPGMWGYCENPQVWGNLIICQPGGEKALVVALDKKTGALVWACSDIDEKAGYSSATIAVIEGVRQVVNFTNKNVVGIDINSGKLLWSFPHETKPDVNCSTPIVYGNYVIASSGYGRGTDCYKIEGGKPAQIWANKMPDNQHGGLIEQGGYVYGSGDRSANWFCLDIRTGNESYSERGVGKGCVLFADGMLYTLSERGKLALVPADPGSHKKAFGFELPMEGSGNFWAYPVISNGIIYIRHDNFLYAYSVVGG